MDIIVYNSILYWLTAFYFYRRKGFTLYSFLWFYYALFSSFSILLMKDDLYFQMTGIGKDATITVVPYILLYISFLTLTKPLSNFTISKFNINNKIYRSKSIHNICKLANYISIIYIIVKLVQIYLVSQIGFGIVHDMKDSTEIIYPGVLGIFLWPLNLIGRINNIAIMPLVVLYSLFGYVNGFVKINRLLFYVIPYGLGTVLMGFVGGSRAAMFFGIMQVLFFYVLFQHYIPSKIKRMLLFFSALFSISLVSVTINITQERFGDAASFTVESSILDYLGQTFPNINYRIWENECTRPMGKRLFPLLFGGMGLDSDYFALNYHTYPWIFHSMWGGLYEEFGLIISIVLIVIISFMMSVIMRHKTFRIEDIALCQFCYYICHTALFDFHIHFVEYVSLIIIIFIRYKVKRIIWKLK